MYYSQTKTTTTDTSNTTKIKKKPNKRSPLLSSSSSSSLSSSSSNIKNNTKMKNNMRLSTDPQSVAARERRHRISDRFKILQSLVPGGSKMDTVSMLEEAIHYVKFLKAQIWLHHNIIMINNNVNTTNYDYLHDQMVIDGHDNNDTMFLTPPDHIANIPVYDHDQVPLPLPDDHLLYYSCFQNHEIATASTSSFDHSNGYI